MNQPVGVERLHEVGQASVAMTQEKATRVLVVDDSPIMLAVLVKHLTSAGYDVFQAADGNEALARIKKNGIQLVITDWEMPGMNGLELCQAIRANETIGFIFVIILTALGDKDCLLEAFNAGADDYLCKPFDRLELVARMRAGERMIVLEQGLTEKTLALQKVNAQFAVLNEKLERMATTDELTGLANRRQAMAKLHEHWDRDEPLCCIMVDIDHFKKFNDNHGHDAGDEVLRRTAASVRKSVPANNWVCRLGGEEFLVICPGIGLANATELAEHIRAAVESGSFTYASKELHVTCSLGVAARQPAMGHRDDLIRQADSALYEAKKNGRNQVQSASSPLAAV